MSGKRQKLLHQDVSPAKGQGNGGPPILKKLAIPLPWAALITATVFLVIRFANDRKAATQAAVTQRNVASFDQLLAIPPADLGGVDIARMNLLCAEGLPGAEDLDIDKCLGTLDRWAARVKQETERHLYRLTDPAYKEHAEHYKHSEARFRAEWLVTVLQQDIGLHYHPGFVPQEANVPPFKTAKETFLHGLMDNDDAHKAFGGNCVSLPVAYVAVGRRLGYPVKLVLAKEHCFCRWEGKDNANPDWRDQFNFDGAGDGFSIDPDEFYLSWPRKSTPDQVELCGWLKSLTPREELAVFLANRGHVLSDVSRDYEDAIVAYAHAARLRPDSTQSVEWVRRDCEAMYGKVVAAHPDAYGKMVARIGGSARCGAPPQVGDPAENLAWWKTEGGREAMRAQVEEENRRNMQRMMHPPPGARQPASPYGSRPPVGVPQPGSPYGPQPAGPQPYQPTTPGQPQRP